MKRSVVSNQSFSVRVLLISILSLLGLGLATSYPLTLQDDLGRTLLLEHEPMRVVSMMASHTEILCAIEACDKLVGVDDFSNYPEAISNLPTLGNGFAPNLELIVSLEPDLVLVDEDSGIVEALENAGLTVFAGTGQSYQETLDSIALLGTLLNRKLEAALLKGRIQGAIDTMSRLVADLDKPTVFYEIDPTPYSVGPASFMGVLIAKAGGENIIDASLGDFPQVSPEYIIAADPEVIILGDAPYGETIASVAQRPGWASLQAVQQGRVYELDQATVDAISRPGPRMVDAVEALIQILYPGLLD